MCQELAADRVPDFVQKLIADNRVRPDVTSVSEMTQIELQRLEDLKLDWRIKQTEQWADSLVQSFLPLKTVQVINGVEALRVLKNLRSTEMWAAAQDVYCGFYMMKPGRQVSVLRSGSTVHVQKTLVQCRTEEPY